MRHKNPTPQKLQIVANDATLKSSIDDFLPQKNNLEIIISDENLALTKISDDNEPDELALIPASKKTKGAEYLKDGWILEDNEYICVKLIKYLKKENQLK